MLECNVGCMWYSMLTIESWFLCLVSLCIGIEVLLAVGFYLLLKELIRSTWGTFESLEISYNFLSKLTWLIWTMEWYVKLCTYLFLNLSKKLHC